MSTMKRILALSAILLLLGSVAAMAQTAPRRHFSNPLLDDVVQMTKAGLSDSTIVAYVKARRSRLSADVTAEDLIRLRDAGVSDSVVSYLAGAAGIENWEETPEASPRAQATYDSEDSPAGPDDDYPVDGGTVAYPYWYGWGYGYPYWYDYGPFFSGGVVIRGHGGFHGGHFHGGGGHFHGGGGHGHGGGGHGGGHGHH